MQPLQNRPSCRKLYFTTSCNFESCVLKQGFQSKVSTSLLIVILHNSGDFWHLPAEIIGWSVLQLYSFLCGLCVLLFYTFFSVVFVLLPFYADILLPYTAILTHFRPMLVLILSYYHALTLLCCCHVILSHWSDTGELLLCCLCFTLPKLCTAVMLLLSHC